MAQTLFITGISTEVGKTVASAIVTEALKADYWKPVQAGELDYCDMKKVSQMVSNDTSTFHPNAFALETPMSPHAAAAIDKVEIRCSDIERPKTENTLVIEGAGGLLVPLNDSETILDLIKPKDHVIVVSRHYLGSINHTLLTVNLLKDKGHKVAILFSGDEHPTTESIIKTMTNVPVIGRIEEEPYFDQNVVKEHADSLRNALKDFIS